MAGPGSAGAGPAQMLSESLSLYLSISQALSLQVSFFKFLTLRLSLSLSLSLLLSELGSPSLSGGSLSQPQALSLLGPGHSLFLRLSRLRLSESPGPLSDSLSIRASLALRQGSPAQAATRSRASSSDSEST